MKIYAVVMHDKYNSSVKLYTSRKEAEKSISEFETAGVTLGYELSTDLYNADKIYLRKGEDTIKLYIKEFELENQS